MNRLSSEFPFPLPCLHSALRTPHSALRRAGVRGRCLLVCLLLALLPSSSLAVSPQLQLLTNQSPPAVFSGQGQTLALRWHNPTDQPITLPLRIRLYQASSATAAPWDEAPWKQLEILPGQTILESATLTLPTVRAETRFLLQFLRPANTVIGTTEILVYPPDLLKELKPLAANEPIGLWDPQAQLKPLLKAVQVEFVDLETTGVESFRGKLALIGPFQSAEQQPPGIAQRLKALASKGLAVVWLLPPPALPEELTPSFYTVFEGKGTIVVAQASLVDGLAHQPQAQLHLLALARQALHPQPARLPYLTSTTNEHE